MGSRWHVMGMLADLLLVPQEFRDDEWAIDYQGLGRADRTLFIFALHFDIFSAREQIDQ